MFIWNFHKLIFILFPFYRALASFSFVSLFFLFSLPSPPHHYLRPFHFIHFGLAFVLVDVHVDLKKKNPISFLILIFFFILMLSEKQRVGKHKTRIAILFYSYTMTYVCICWLCHCLLWNGVVWWLLYMQERYSFCLCLWNRMRIKYLTNRHNIWEHL